MYLVATIGAAVAGVAALCSVCVVLAAAHFMN